MNAKDVVTVVMWAATCAVLTAFIYGVLFGWRDESGVIARNLIFMVVFMGLCGAWDAIRRVKKRRRADQVAGRVDVSSSAPAER